MGANNQKGTNNVTAQIKLDKTIFLPGQMLTGKLQLVGKASMKFGNVTYTILEEEFWSVNRILAGKENNHRTNTVFNITLNYPNLVNTSLEKGATIPFQIQLPNFLKPSFEYSTSEKTGSIRNILSIVIEELGIRYNAFFIIQKGPEVLQSPLSLSTKESGKILGLIGKGDVQITASYPRNNFVFFEHIPLKIQINSSKSKTKIKKVEVRLNRVIKFLMDGKEDKMYRTIEDELFYKSYDMLNNDLIINDTIQIIEPPKIYEKYVISTQGFNITDKTQLILFLPSMNTTTFNCTYWIQIDAIFDQVINILKNPTLNMPLMIGHIANVNVTTTPTVASFNQQFQQNVNNINSGNAGMPYNSINMMQPQPGMPQNMPQNPMMQPQPGMPQNMPQNMPQYDKPTYQPDQQVSYMNQPAPPSGYDGNYNFPSESDVMGNNMNAQNPQGQNFNGNPGDPTVGDIPNPYPKI
ncbi:MAG: hypothetical protein MJ252_25090 [archaeon]|nr:hypothetical protein [archaeon]